LPTSLPQRIHTSYSLPAGQIYAQAFVRTITATKRLRLLGYLAHGASVECRPSWAPDLTRSRYDNVCEGVFSLATGHSTAHVTFEPPDELHVRGIFRDKSKAISSTTNGDDRLGYEPFHSHVSSHLPHTADEENLGTFAWIYAQAHVCER
jgi:hypothetical protein